MEKNHKIKKIGAIQSKPNPPRPKLTRYSFSLCDTSVNRMHLMVAKSRTEILLLQSFSGRSHT